MHNHSAGGSPGSIDLIMAVPFLVAALLYCGGVAVQSTRGRTWPWHRSAAWFLGLVAAAAGFVGPLASAAHTDFVAHMWSHLLVGMVAPLLLVTAAPVTLAFRSLPLRRGRQISRVLRSWPSRLLALPIVAAGLHVGGMWLTYLSGLYTTMQQNPLVHTAVMVHVLLAGILFTAVIIPFDPSPHRSSFAWRMGVLVVAVAAHNILAKLIYASPPPGVPTTEGRAGALLMYYGGDVVDVVVIGVLCAQWYRHAGRRRLSEAERPAARTTAMLR